jgi:hypothetical protein
VQQKRPVSLPAKESCASPRTQQAATGGPQSLPSVLSEAIQSPNVAKNVAAEANATTSTSLQTRSIISHDSGARHDREELEEQFNLSHEYHPSQYRAFHPDKAKTHHIDTPLNFDPSLSVSHHGSHHVSKNFDHIDAMETSCDTAASILVDLHHHADAERARVALGCEGPNSCTVNNIKIFQLLEKFP